MSESTALDPEILSHAADCQCRKCKAFFWELFIARDERDIMQAGIERTEDER